MKTKQIQASIDLSNYGFEITKETAEELYKPPHQWSSNHWLEFNKIEDICEVLTDKGRKKSIKIKKEILNPKYSIDVETDHGYYGETEVRLILEVSGEVEITLEEEKYQEYSKKKVLQTKKEQKKKVVQREKKLLKELLEKYPEVK